MTSSRGSTWQKDTIYQHAGDQTAPGAEGKEQDDGPMEQQHQRAEPSIQQNQGNLSFGFF